ncbi:MAG TPA: thiolase domain-containing protein [Candidatus Acidoferrales bacterium]|nr:thiolase domain-containing protein [Candidatus Acidoferrales bacterium]
MRKVAIVGVGHSRFGDRRDVNLPELAFEAAKPAFEDANLTSKDVDFLSVGTAGGWYEEFLPAVVVSEYLGLSGKGLVRCEAACASGSAAVATAYNTIASGQNDVAMAVGIEKMTEVDTLTAVELIGRAGYYLWEFHNFGMTFPGYYALHATAHMKKFGTTEEQLAEVAVKNHKYGSMNPYAHLQRAIKIDDVLSSRMVAWPLKLYDCSPISDGAAAIILASEEKAKSLTDSPVWIEAIGTSSDTANISKRSGYTGLEATVIASEKAFKRANVGPDQFDVADVHDCFTIAELLAYEDLGFCERGEGGKMIDEGQTEIGGKIPVNVDGGLKAKGHPIGATGVSMMVGLTRQLRKQAGKTQVPIKNGLALAHNVGGTGHYCYVTVLRS